MEEPMFYQGQAVRCVDAADHGFSYPNARRVIEGKRYYIKDPICEGITIKGDGVRRVVTLEGFGDQKFWQMRFIAEEDDQNIEEEIHQALKGQKIVN